MSDQLYSAQTRCSNLHFFDVEFFPTYVYITHHFPDGLCEGYAGKIPVENGIIIWGNYIFTRFKFPLEVRDYFDNIAKIVYRNKAFW